MPVPIIAQNLAKRAPSIRVIALLKVNLLQGMEALREIEAGRGDYVTGSSGWAWFHIATRSLVLLPMFSW